MGEEMAELMSEEITKVMDEQRAIEVEYARLVEQRDQLKGITNKHRLEETKGEILVSHTLPLAIYRFILSLARTTLFALNCQSISYSFEPKSSNSNN